MEIRCGRHEYQNIDNFEHVQFLNTLITMYVQQFLKIEESKNPDKKMSRIYELNSLRIEYMFFDYYNYNNKMLACVKSYHNIDTSENIPFLAFGIKVSKYPENVKTHIKKGFNSIREHQNENYQVKIYKMRSPNNEYKFLLKFDHKNYSDNNLLIRDCKIENLFDVISWTKRILLLLILTIIMLLLFC